MQNLEQPKANPESQGKEAKIVRMEADINATVHSIEVALHGVTVEDVKNPERRQQIMNALLLGLDATYNRQTWLDDDLISQPGNKELEELHDALSFYHRVQIGLMNYIAGTKYNLDAGDLESRLRSMRKAATTLDMLTLLSSDDFRQT